MPPEINLFDVFLLVFIGIGPLKVLVVYIALTKELSTAQRRKVAQKMVLTATIVAIVLLVAGVVIMKILHFTTGALSIAGGLILLLLALSMVMGTAEHKEHDGPLSEEEIMSMAIYPLAIPLLLNPVGIVTLTVFSAESAEPAPVRGTDHYGADRRGHRPRCVPDLPSSLQKRLYRTHHGH